MAASSSSRKISQLPNCLVSVFSSLANILTLTLARLLLEFPLAMEITSYSVSSVLFKKVLSPLPGPRKKASLKLTHFLFKQAEQVYLTEGYSLRKQRKCLPGVWGSQLLQPSQGAGRPSPLLESQLQEDSWDIPTFYVFFVTSQTQNQSTNLEARGINF